VSNIILNIDDNPNAEHLVREAIQSEIGRLRLALNFSRKNLARFETKYGTTSHHFFLNGASEDLEQGDIEYAEWVGEYELSIKVEEDIAALEGIQYVDS